LACEAGPFLDKVGLPRPVDYKELPVRLVDEKRKVVAMGPV
jgi:hypothetical protein